MFKFTNSTNPDQLVAVAQFDPGDPGFSGGRWSVQLTTWTAEGLADGQPLLTSYADILAAIADGDVTVTSANFYFFCPLLPVK